MTSEPIALGLQIVPTMGSAELIDTVVAAEELGYPYCMVADEGLMLDVYAVLGAAAQVTSTIRLGAVTNPYTRHPSPPRILKNLGLNEAGIAGLKQAFNQGGPEAVGRLVTDELVASYQIAGPPAECRSQLQHLISAHRLDAFFVNIISPGLAANRELLSEVVSIAAKRV